MSSYNRSDAEMIPYDLSDAKIFKIFTTLLAASVAQAADWTVEAAKQADTASVERRYDDAQAHILYAEKFYRECEKCFKRFLSWAREAAKIGKDTEEACKTALGHVRRAEEAYKTAEASVRFELSFHGYKAYQDVEASKAKFELWASLNHPQTETAEKQYSDAVEDLNAWKKAWQKYREKYDQDA